MKKLIIIFLFLQLISVKSYSQIVYIDINLILNTSEVGKSLNNHLKLINDINIKKYKTIENEIAKKEQDLLAQQNIIEKTDFDKKFKELSNEVIKYRSEKKSSVEKINNVKLENVKKILNILNPIITNYVNENKISLVIPKKNIIVGKKNLDITEIILRLLNEKIKTLKF